MSLMLPLRLTARKVKAISMDVLTAWIYTTHLLLIKCSVHRNTLVALCVCACISGVFLILFWYLDYSITFHFFYCISQPRKHSYKCNTSNWMVRHCLVMWCMPGLYCWTVFLAGEMLDYYILWEFLLVVFFIVFLMIG